MTVIGSLIGIVTLVLLARSDDPDPPAASVNETPSLVQRSLEGQEFGLSDPLGIAVVPETGGLYVFWSGGVAELSPTGRQVRSIEIPAEVGVPLGMTYDIGRDRLLILASGPLRVVELDVRREEDGTSPVVHSLSALQLEDPVGIAMDPTTTDLVILNAEGPSLVYVRSTKSGFENRASVTVDLGTRAVDEVGGIAFDPSTGFIYVIDPSQKLIYELGLDGRILGVQRLSGLELGEMVPMVFAASRDQTDEASATSLYVAISASDDDPGRILELSVSVKDEPIVASFTSKIINTFNVASFDPPSPDSSGITYVPRDGQLVMVDSEVDETVEGISHFEGVNLWQLSIEGDALRTANISQKQPTAVAMTNEPTGITWNSLNGHYYVSDDNVLRIFDLDPGPDGMVGTADDLWSSFPTSVAGNNDPEGVAYDARQKSIFVVDGLNQEVYQYTTEGEPLSNFDVARYGVVDPEGIAFNQISGTLFILGGGARPIIVETTTTGELLRTINIDIGTAVAPAGLVYAPASDGSDTLNFFIAFRGVDNNTDPTVVDGGPDVDVGIPAEAVLQVLISDNGLPDPPTGSQITGPGLVTLSDSTPKWSSAIISLP